MRDEEMWLWWGNYGLSAVSTAVEHNLHGRKAKSKYISEPIMKKAVENQIQEKKLLTEEEKKKQTETLFAKLKIMGANFKLKN